MLWWWGFSNTDFGVRPQVDRHSLRQPRAQLKPGPSSFFCTPSTSLTFMSFAEHLKRWHNNRARACVERTPRTDSRTREYFWQDCTNLLTILKSTLTNYEGKNERCSQCMERIARDSWLTIYTRSVGHFYDLIPVNRLRDMPNKTRIISTNEGNTVFWISTSRLNIP